MPLRVEYSDSVVEIEELSGDKRRITVRSRDGKQLHRRASWETAYSLELIEMLLQAIGPALLCREIAREEDPSYCNRYLSAAVEAFLGDDYQPASILDYGCGCGASSILLARRYPQATVLGVDVSEQLTTTATLRCAHYRLSNAGFRSSNGRNGFPSGLGRFDMVVLHAVVEHMLPDERRLLLPLIWDAVSPGGVLLIVETPHRFFPVERHTTGLPLINYLPAGAAMLMVRALARTAAAGSDWERLLRGGVRGSSLREIVHLLGRSGSQPPIVVSPRFAGYRDGIDVWYRSQPSTPRRRLAMRLFKQIKALTGITLIPDFSVALAKPADT